MQLLMCVRVCNAQARCAQTTPPPPPTCAMDLEKLQEKIAGQNATCAKMWVQLDLVKQVMDLSAGLVEDSEKSVAPATAQAVQSFQAMQSLLEVTIILIPCHPPVEVDVIDMHQHKANDLSPPW
jgi:hypothetical protein